MSIDNGIIGNRRNNLLRVRLTSEESKRLEEMAASYNMEKSELVRGKIFGNPVDYIKSEIDNAISKVKDRYQKATKKAKECFLEPEDAYLPAYASNDYGFSQGYN